ncbi:hypothetical protein NUSPORA_00844 [Nucleospora cyclopteri]
MTNHPRMKVNKKESQNQNYDPNLKTLFRGKFHFMAFIFTIILTVLFLLLSCFKKFDFFVLLYLIVQIIQFGISSLYHMSDVSPSTKHKLRILDHMAIFLLISGTQTAVLNTIPTKNPVQFSKVLLISWSLSAAGIVKLLVFTNLHNIFDLICYMAHGLIVLPIIKSFEAFYTCDIVCLLLGGLFYLLGGVIYGLEKPNPIPRIFGFHEIFHIFTLMGNSCFGLCVLRAYLKLLY